MSTLLGKRKIHVPSRRKTSDTDEALGRISWSLPFDNLRHVTYTAMMSASTNGTLETIVTRKE